MNKNILRFLIKKHDEGESVGRYAIADQFGLSQHESRIYAYISKHMDDILDITSGAIDLREVNKSRIAPNVLIIDIETAPILARVWGLWKQDINLDFIVKDWFMLTWSCKWLNEPDIYSGAVTPEEAIECNDKRISEDIWQFIEKADVIMAHNGKRFDMPRLNTRFILNGIGNTT